MVTAGPYPCNRPKSVCCCLSAGGKVGVAGELDAFLDLESCLSFSSSISRSKSSAPRPRFVSPLASIGRCVVVVSVVVVGGGGNLSAKERSRGVCARPRLEDERSVVSLEREALSVDRLSETVAS